MTIPRVLYVITDSGIGGSETVLSHLIRGHDAAKMSICGIVVIKDKREMAFQWEAQGVPVTALKIGRWPSPLAFFKVRAALARYKPDVVHAFLFHSVQFSRLVKKLGGHYKLVSSPRVNYRFAPKWSLTVDRLLKGEDDVALCESRSTQTFLTQKLGYRPDKTAVVLNGVEAEAMARDPSLRAQVRKEWGVADHEIVIGGVGRLHAQKGFDVLIRALALLKDLKIPSRCVLIGEGPEKGALQRLAGQLNVPVIFAGKRISMRPAYSGFDIFAQSSRYEGLSNALLEALAAGCACAATAVDGTLDIAEDGKNMLLVKPDNPEALAVALGFLLEKPASRAQLASYAAASAKNFSIPKMVQGFMACYERLGTP